MTCAYAIIYRNDLEGNATRAHLLADLGTTAELRGVCRYGFRTDKSGSAADGEIYAVSIKDGNLLDLEGRLKNAAAAADADQDDEVGSQALGKKWYTNILAGCDDYQSDNALFVGIAKELASSRIRGR